jgi:hypothetical protein
VRTQRTLGIDLGAKPENTAACLIRWDRSGAVIEELIKGTRSDPLDDDRLTGLIEGATKAGIDAPFGWPIPFVKAIRQWERSSGAGGRWPKPDNLETYRYRVTDRQIVEPRPPLSVSSDLIGVTAMRCAGLLSRLDDVDRSGAKGPVIEVYPAAALYRWGFPAEGYKKVRGTAIRQDLVKQLCRRLESLCPLQGDHRRLCERYDDAVDALVASLVVRARLLRKTSKPRPAERDAAKVEGWIHIPTCTLEGLERV